MFTAKVNGLIFSIMLCSNIAFAFPSASHVGEVSDTLDRLDKVTNVDFVALAIKEPIASQYISPLGLVLTEPLVRALWTSQVLSNADWIALQGLASIHNKIDPGGAEGDGSNLFIYACKAGWIDMGHLISTALAFKVMYQGLLPNSPLQFIIAGFLQPEEGKRYTYIAQQLNNTGWAEDKGLKKKGDQFFWARFFAMRAGFKIEETQLKTRLSQTRKNFDSNATSAYTLEDIPSDYYGTQVAERMERKHTVGGVVKVFRRELIQLMHDYQAVDLQNEVNDNGHFVKAKEILQRDAKYYEKRVLDTDINLKDKKASSDPKNAYNYTVVYKKTLSHDILCNSDGTPRGTDQNPTANQANPKPKTKPKFSSIRK